MASVDYKIKLTQGKSTLVDNDTYEWASKYKWYAAHWKDNMFYAQRGGKQVNKKREQHISLHRDIMKPKKYEVVDHINGNTLDNRKCNLRVCSAKDNSRNQTKLSKNNTSGYKGVSWDKNANKWIARIKVDKKLIHLGYFVDLIKATKAYDVAAKKHFKDFAFQNFKEPK